MITHPTLISTEEGILELAEKLKSQPIIAFDTEFIRESTFFPIVEIIQVATEEESWLVDAQAFKRGFKPGAAGGYNPGFKPLADIFENRAILKILHAAQGDQECLYTSFGIVASPSLDTAVAASLCGLGDGIGLSKLLKTVLDVEIKKGHARTNWSVRPLPAQLTEYAHADVIHLVRLGKRLMERLTELKRAEWGLELSAKWEDKTLYESDIEGTARKLARNGRLDKKGFGSLVELIRWREERVRALNLPRRWVADDAVLVDLAHVRPTDRAHLESFRGLNKGEVKNSGEAILGAIKRGADEAARIVAEIPRKQGGAPRPEIPTNEENQVLDLLRCYVGILADQHKIAAKHLTNTAQLLPLLRGEIKTPADLVSTGALTGKAATLVGEELIAFVNGKRALSVEGAQIKIVQV